MSMPGRPAPGGGSGRRSLIDQTLTRCLNGLENIIVSDAYTKMEKIGLLDSHVYNCVNSVLALIYPLVKRPRYVALAVVMIEDAVAGMTGTPITSGFTELQNARLRALNCMKLIANSALISRRWTPPSEGEGVREGEEELTRRDMRQVITGTKDVSDFAGTASGIQLLASRLLRLVEDAESTLDFVDADMYLETAYLTATRIAVDKYVRKAFASSNTMTSDFDPDPITCLRRTYEEYKNKLEALLSGESPSASLAGRAWRAYSECVEFLKKSEVSPCRDKFNERDKNLCARQHCASAVIQTLPSIVERLGASTMTSPQVVY